MKACVDQVRELTPQKVGSEDYKNIRPPMIVLKAPQAIEGFHESAPWSQSDPNTVSAHAFHDQAQHRKGGATPFGGTFRIYGSRDQRSRDTTSESPDLERRASSSEDSAPYTPPSLAESIHRSDGEGFLASQASCSSFDGPTVNAYAPIGVSSIITENCVVTSAGSSQSVAISAMNSRQLPIPTPSSSWNPGSTLDTFPIFNFGPTPSQQPIDPTKFNHTTITGWSSPQRFKYSSYDSGSTFSTVDPHLKARQEQSPPINDMQDGQTNFEECYVPRFTQGHPNLNYPTTTCMSSSELFDQVSCSTPSDGAGQADYWIQVCNPGLLVPKIAISKFEEKIAPYLHISEANGKAWSADFDLSCVVPRQSNTDEGTE